MALRNSAVDAVQILAVLEKPTGAEVLLEKQYRPPVDKTVIELPAGLLDEGESTRGVCAAGVERGDRLHWRDSGRPQSPGAVQQ